MKKKSLPYLIAGVLILLIIVKNSLNHQLTLTQLSNDLFLCAMPFLIIGGFLWVFSSGFFDHFQRSIYLARTRNRKKKPEFSSLSSASYGMYTFWLIIAGILLALSIVLVIFSFLWYVTFKKWREIKTTALISSPLFLS